jgi:DNA modification methylase
MTIHHGDCVEVMAAMPPDSIDAIVCDPPYGLEFMGKEWDRLDGAGFHAPKDEGRTFSNASGHMFDNLKALPRYGSPTNMQQWHEQWATAALRVAKPGAYLLAFGGTRTVHRMTVALEDAGWIIRDMLVWAYACLSDDTEILTREGWVRYNRANVGQWIAAFDPGSGAVRWEQARAVHVYDHEGTMAEVGPQVVTLNHRVVIDPETARVPRLSGMWDDIHEARSMVAEGSVAGLLEGVQREAAHPRSEVCTGTGMVSGAPTTLVGEDDRSAEPRLEGRRYRVQEAWQLLGRPVRASTGVGATDGTSGRVRHGTPAGDGAGVRVPADQDRMREPREPRPDRQRADEPDALAGQPDAQAVRVGQVSTWHGEPDTLRLVSGYAGKVWCVTVPSGAFVARRNGVVFVTGNSGFPKSRALLKPAWEPIVMARKPGPLRDLDIEGCRIGTDAGWSYPNGAGGNTFHGQDRLPMPVASSGGRWPANVVLTDAVLDEYSRFFLVPKASRSDREPVMPGMLEAKNEFVGPGSVDPDRPTVVSRRNVHPTVKPIELMRHLVRLVTPAGGTVLDPFLGSGTTALAAEQEGRQWVGIEREAEYVRIAEARLSGWQRGLGLDI